MSRLTLQNWLASVASKPRADILVVQTLRNAIMAASVLASAAMVALMGVLATAHLHPKVFAIVAAALLAFSAAAAITSVVKLAGLGLELQLESPAAHLQAQAEKLSISQKFLPISAFCLALALFIAAAALLP